MLLNLRRRLHVATAVNMVPMYIGHMPGHDENQHVSLFNVFVVFSFQVNLPEGWINTLPKADHQWVSQALFTTNARAGKAELDFSRYFIIITN